MSMFTDDDIWRRLELQRLELRMAMDVQIGTMLVTIHPDRPGAPRLSFRDQLEVALFRDEPNYERRLREFVVMKLTE